jgi:hypothetical protein
VTVPPRAISLRGLQYLVHIRSPAFIGKARIIEVGFEFVGALNCGIHKAGTVPAMSFGECSRASTVFGACAPIGGSEGAKSAVRPEVGTVP